MELGKDDARTHQIDMVSDSAAALNMTPEMVQLYKNLVTQAGLTFGARHYNGYHWLLTLSDHVAQFGLEHHESSDDRTAESAITDENQHLGLATLLAHEYTHSWNGKYRRPAGLATGDFSKPMQGDLLWIYEGLTNYLGELLPARSGLMTPEQYRDQLAETAASMEHNTGRTWRPLSDTATGAQSMFNASQEWGSWRRGYDYYPEGTLIWLEADVLIREKTQGKKSLNDFLRLFHGGANTGPALKPYTLDDVINTIRQVLDYDWKGFFNMRVFVPNPHAPMGGIEGGGWKLVYSDTQSDAAKARSVSFKGADLRYSLGLMIKEDSTIQDVVFGLPAEKAGLAPGMKLIAVNNRKYSADGLKAVVKQAKGSAEPILLLVENTEFYKTYKVDYHRGERYPHLERDNAKPDILSEVMKPLTPRGK